MLCRVRAIACLVIKLQCKKVDEFIFTSINTLETGKYLTRTFTLKCVDFPACGPSDVSATGLGWMVVAGLPGGSEICFLMQKIIILFIETFQLSWKRSFFYARKRFLRKFCRLLLLTSPSKMLLRKADTRNAFVLCP